MKKAQGHNPMMAAIKAASNIPTFNFKKLGIVSRDYRHAFPNNRRDFSHSLPAVLGLLDKELCDAVVFSMYSIIPRNGYSVASKLDGLNSIKAIFIEEFADGPKRAKLRNIVYYRARSQWRSCELHQQFGSLSTQPKHVLSRFVADELPNKRLVGSCCVILCGELNGIKYSKVRREAEDTFGLMAALPDDVNLVVNPMHDRMTRFEMPLKRRFLSKGRWVVSVWNKGKMDGNGKIRDGDRPAWDVYYDGKQKNDAVEIIPNDLNLEIGVLELGL